MKKSIKECPRELLEKTFIKLFDQNQELLQILKGLEPESFPSVIGELFGNKKRTNRRQSR